MKPGNTLSSDEVFIPNGRDVTASVRSCPKSHTTLCTLAGYPVVMPAVVRLSSASEHGMHCPDAMPIPTHAALAHVAAPPCDAKTLAFTHFPRTDASSGHATAPGIGATSTSMTSPLPAATLVSSARAAALSGA